MLADINPDLINLYREVTRYPDLVIDAARELFNSKNSPQGYNEVRAAFNKQVGTVKAVGCVMALKWRALCALLNSCI